LAPQSVARRAAPQSADVPDLATTLGGSVHSDPTTTRAPSADSAGVPGAVARAASAPVSAADLAAAPHVLAAFVALESALAEAETELAALDAVAGDGDHGRGMLRGVRAARDAARAAVDDGSGARGVIDAAGTAWADRAGGTSGVLWGAM